MKLNKILILLSFIFICITKAQAIVTYNENGVEMEFFYDSNGKLHGPMTWFFPNGGIMQQNNYRHGEFHGQTIVYHSYLVKKALFNSKYGDPHGLEQSWDKNGQLLKEGYWVDGKRHGFWKYYNQNTYGFDWICFINGIETNVNPKDTCLPESNEVVKKEVIKSNELINRDGKSSWRYDNGQLGEEGNYIKGKKDGKWIRWSKSGDILRESNFKNGKLIDETQYKYYKNGLISKKSIIKNGELIKTNYTYFDNNQKKTQETFLNGHLHGKSIEWDKDGQKTLEAMYKDNALNGLVTQWDKDGQKTHEGMFADGKKNGQLTVWDFLGKEVSTYINDELHGVSIQYDRDGRKKSESNYINGRLQGITKKWTGSLEDDYYVREEHYYENDKLISKNQFSYENGNLIALLKYKNGLLDGKQLFWYESGEKKNETNMIEGNAISSYITWHKNGQKQVEKIFIDGVLDGVVVYWDENGKIEREEFYKDGIKIKKADLKAQWVRSIEEKVKSNWRYQVAYDDWTAEVYIVQDRDGTILTVDVRDLNDDDSQTAKVFKDSIKRAVYKSSPLPSAPIDELFNKELIFIF